MLYEGDNDVAQGVSPAEIAATFERILARLHDALPETRIYVLSIKPSIARWRMWDTMVAANALLAERCAADDRLTYIDVASPMLDGDAKPMPEIFVDDMLHMNGAGYDIWRDAVRPVLLAGELAAE